MKTRTIVVWLYIFGCFKLVFNAVFADSFQQDERGRRIKRFLFNKDNEPNITYGAVTLCCECNDFDESNSCHKNCRTGSGYGSMKVCVGQLCSTTASLINDRFYIESGCVAEKVCQDERNVYAQTKGCRTMLKKEMSNGTKCGYCCRDLDLTVHGTSHNSDCLNNLDKLVSHAYSQNLMTTAATTTTTKIPASTSATREKSTTNIPKSTTATRETVSTTDAIYKTTRTISDNTKILSSQQIEQICKARTDSKPDFPYPGDETKYIQCDEFGKYFVRPCPDGTVWDDSAQTCNFGHNHVTRLVSTKAVTSLLKTTLKRSTEHTAYSLDTITTPPSGELTTSSRSNVINATSALASTFGLTGVACHTCTDDENCEIKRCQSTDAYCLNVIRVYANGSQTVTKKSCASFYECEYDHSLRSSQCDTAEQSNNASISNEAVLCQYCCKASKSSPPCNIQNLPDKIDWFQGSSPSVPQVSGNGTTIRYNSTEKPTSTLGNKTSISQNILVSSPPPLNTSLSIFNTTEVHSSTVLNKLSTRLTNALLSTTTKNTTITKPVSFTSPTPGQSVTTRNSIPQTINTTAPASKTTTKTPPYTIPPRTARCLVCSGPEFLCEKLFEEKDCAAPNHYCVNTLKNNLDGSRVVTRRCANFDTCYRDWFLGSSDSDKCRRFNEKQILTLDFTCTYCCVTDGCNLSVNPPYDTLYTDV